MLNIINNPLEQFDIVIITTIFNNFSFTNFTIMLIVNFTLVLILLSSFSFFNGFFVYFCSVFSPGMTLKIKFSKLSDKFKFQEDLNESI